MSQSAKSHGELSNCLHDIANTFLFLPMCHVHLGKSYLEI